MFSQTLQMTCMSTNSRTAPAIVKTISAHDNSHNIQLNECAPRSKKKWNGAGMELLSFKQWWLQRFLLVLPVHHHVAVATEGNL